MKGASVLDFLRDVLSIIAWFFFDIVPMILTAPLGAIGELNDILGEINWLIGLIPMVGGAAIAFYKKYIR